MGWAERLSRRAGMVAGNGGRPELNDLNAGFAQAAARRCLERATVIERRLKASPIAGPDGRSAAQIDVAGEMVHFMREASYALCSILDLLMEARTGEPCLRRETANQKPADGVNDAPRG